MKKHLLSTSVLALGTALALPPSAQDWDLDWGGFMNQHVAFGDISTPGVAGVEFDGDGLDLHQTSEIIFSPSVTLDNGMTFGINIQFEGERTAANIDETYMSISSDTLGRFDIGAENSAGYKSMVAAPGVTSMAINSPSTSAFIPYTGVDAATGSLTALPFRQAGISAYTEVAGNNDVQRLTYYTPDFNGLVVGVSYAPQGAVNAASGFSVNKNAVLSDIIDIGVNYSGSFGSTDISLGARWGTGETPNAAFAPRIPGTAPSDPETWGVGFQVSFNNLTVGGSYAENDNDESLVTAGPTAAGISDSEGWSFGVTYDTAGPWAFEAQTYQSETDIASLGVATGAQVENESYRIGASRALGAGVDWDIYVIYDERDDTRSAFTDVDGTLVGTAINLSF